MGKGLLFSHLIEGQQYQFSAFATQFLANSFHTLLPQRPFCPRRLCFPQRLYFPQRLLSPPRLFFPQRLLFPLCTPFSGLFLQYRSTELSALRFKQRFFSSTPDSNCAILAY
jgi:hypothetical protein